MSTATLPSLVVRPCEHSPLTACPMCGQILPTAPEPFYVMVRINGHPRRLVDPDQIGGRHVGRRLMKPIQIVQVES